MYYSSLLCFLLLTVMPGETAREQRVELLIGQLTHLYKRSVDWDCVPVYKLDAMTLDAVRWRLMQSLAIQDATKWPTLRYDSNKLCLFKWEYFIGLRGPVGEPGTNGSRIHHLYPNYSSIEVPLLSHLQRVFYA